MTIRESNVAQNIAKSVYREVGKLYFFKYFAVIEFNEGVHVDKNNTKDLLDELSNYFGTQQPFGLVANRVNSYSINLMDMKDMTAHLFNLECYSAIGHCRASIMNAEIENAFFGNGKISYTNLYEALNDTYRKIKYKSRHANTS